MMVDVTALADAVRLYVEGFHESDASKLASVFHPGAVLFAVRDGVVQSTPVADYLQLVGQRLPVRLEDRRKEIHSISFAGETVAVARLTVSNDASQFDDALTLVRDTSGWRIISKAFHASVNAQRGSAS